jgi:hypothetical protein
MEITFGNSASFLCPYCDHVNTYRSYKAPIGKNYNFEYCDTEEGGCGKRVLLKTIVTVKLEMQVFKMPDEVEEAK